MPLGGTLLVEQKKLACLQNHVRLLESQLNISEVAQEFGHRDIVFFSRQFKQVLGRSPRTYRRRVCA